MRKPKRGGSTALKWLAGACCLAFLGATWLAEEGQCGQIEKFDPAQYQGAMGRIVLPLKGQAFLLVMDAQGSRILHLTSKDGSFQAPVGQFKLLRYYATTTDASQEKWIVTGTPAQDKSQLNVTADASVDLEVGPPFTASVTVTKEQDQANLSLTLLGRGGDKCVIQKMGPPEPPSFQVVAQGGQVVWSAAFKFG